MAEHVFFFDRLPPDSVAMAGGKGASLSRMALAGLPVPPGFIVSAEAFQHFLETVGGVEVIASLTRTLDVEDSSVMADASAQIRRVILESPLPGPLAEAITDAHARLPNGGLVAVRSSAVSEDGSAASFAGQQDTYLDVRGIDEVLRRVPECWASFFSPRALFYRAQKSVLADTRMAVVIQEMVLADRSGVMFTVDPIRGRHDCMVIEAAPGLGDAIVSGEVTPDHHVLSREDGAVVDEFIPDGGRGRVLRDRDLDQLWTLGLTLETFFGAPQDVEWCIRGDELLVLQSRPITTLAAHA